MGSGERWLGLLSWWKALERRAEGYWRYLGVVQNGDGEIEGMLEAVEAEVREEAAVLGRKASAWRVWRT
jgi:hypothetical protein